ncbi:MAG: polymer-forming cytoskeletal protein [Planctomycetes bacterium]|nr:polymer-forming cytoskeletal protein [Planctomycetota bacterium]
MPSTSKVRGGAAKQVVCTHCERPIEVGRRAMSIFCPHCKKRLILEDYKITSYYAVREFSTCGDIVVEKKGHVVAPIKVGTLTVKGKVQGTVSARVGVKLMKTGSLQGDIEAPSFVIEPGAAYDGFVKIGPAEPPSNGKSTAKIKRS